MGCIIRSTDFGRAPSWPIPTSHPIRLDSAALPRRFLSCLSGGPLAWQRSKHFRRSSCKASRAAWQSGSSRRGDLHPSRVLSRVWGKVVDGVPGLGSGEVGRRAAVSLAAIALYRLGFFVPLPSLHLANLPSPLQAIGEGHTFGRAPTVPANIFLLGIGPIIAASIVTSLWAVLPWTRDIGRKEGREGEASMRLTTRILAAAFGLIMGAQTAVRLLPYAAKKSGFVLDTTLTLTAGSMILAHLAEEVSEFGLGEGISLMVATSILERQCQSSQQILGMWQSGLIAPKQVALGVVMLALLVYGALMLAYTEKLYEIVSYKFKPMERRRKRGGKEARIQNLPIRISPSGVSVLLTVSLYLSYLPFLVGFWNRNFRVKLAAWLMSNRVLPFAVSLLSFVLVTVDFTFGRMLGDLTSWMQRSSAGIKAKPPLLPGGATQRFLARQQSLAHFWGGLAVATLGGLAFALDQVSKQAVGVEMGAVSLLLLTGQLTLIYRQVETLSAIPRLGRRLLAERHLFETFGRNP